MRDNHRTIASILCSLLAASIGGLALAQEAKESKPPAMSPCVGAWSEGVDHVIGRLMIEEGSTDYGNGYRALTLTVQLRSIDTFKVHSQPKIVFLLHDADGQKVEPHRSKGHGFSGMQTQTPWGLAVVPPGCTFGTTYGADTCPSHDRLTSFGVRGKDQILDNYDWRLRPGRYRLSARVEYERVADKSVWSGTLDLPDVTFPVDELRPQK